MIDVLLSDIDVHLAQSPNLEVGVHTVLFEEVHQFLCHVFGTLLALSAANGSHQGNVNALILQECVAPLHAFQSVAIDRVIVEKIFLL